jgi:hypothetical protein
LFFSVIPFAVGAWLGVLGGLGIANGIKMLSNPVKVSKPPTQMAVLEILGILGCNGLSLVIGILNWVFYNDDEVKSYLSRGGVGNGSS